MIKNLLLPHRFKRIGWWLLAADVLFFASLFLIFNSFNLLHWSWSRPLTNTAMIAGMIAICLVTFSREKVEDEYITALRSQTLTIVFYLFFVLSMLWTILGTLQIFELMDSARETIPVWRVQIPIVLTNIWCAFIVYIAAFNIRLWMLKLRVNPEN